MTRWQIGFVAALGILAGTAATASSATPPVDPSQLCGPNDIYVREIVWRDRSR